MTTQIAAQMYTLREFCKTPADIARSLKRVKQIGYGAVQASGMGPIDASELASILKNEGLICCATHVGLDQMEANATKIIEDHHLWGCEYTAIGGYFPKDGGSDEDWTNFIPRFNSIARTYAGSGLSIGYHNHSHELVRHFLEAGKTTGGEPVLKTLIKKLDPSIFMEIDTYWITHGGGDPVQWIELCKGRIPCVHLKDMAITGKREQLMAEVGEGNLNFPAIIKACKGAGTKWFIVEQDVCQRDPFESLKISLQNVKALGLS